MESMEFFSRISTRMTSLAQSADLKQWNGLQSRFDIGLKDFLVKPSRPEFGNSSQDGSKRNTPTRSAREIHEASSPARSWLNISGIGKHVRIVVLTIFVGMDDNEFAGLLQMNRPKHCRTLADGHLARKLFQRFCQAALCPDIELVAAGGDLRNFEFPRRV